MESFLGVLHLFRSASNLCLYVSEKLALLYGENGRRWEALQLFETVVEANTRT